MVIKHCAYFNGFNGHMARSSKQILQLREQKKITGSQIWRIGCLKDDYYFVFGQAVINFMNFIPKKSGLLQRMP